MIIWVVFSMCAHVSQWTLSSLRALPLGLMILSALEFLCKD